MLETIREYLRQAAISACDSVIKFALERKRDFIPKPPAPPENHFYRKNFTMSLPEATDGAVFKNCNFSVLKPGREIFKELRGLQFEGCNLVNCTLPAGSVVIGGNTTQRDLEKNPPGNLPTDLGYGG